MRRLVAVAGVAALTLAVPSVAGADPNVPEGNLTNSVLSIDPGSAVRGIDLSDAVIPLEEEETSGSQVTVRISADVLFDFGKATLTRAAKRRIAELAPRLRAAKGAVQVSGHSDSIGDSGYNLTLSEQRAEAVKAELQNALKGANLRIGAKGYGETKPVAPNEQNGKDDPAGRAKNRRVEVTYEKG
ncbi:OmpA family protein [Actinomadura darangshiensis]|uniref:OmpA family protein n=1 Tax=Actinomadura darangshiensis TaxID=705336 RepID=A0A4R5BBZ1_9ACTN|nr:OmpA family protein [Actinomadura darangshiensis]TDD81022.1 OmpA family protein [Actinomadura darangshiensis]